jgi:hypothetical protein
MQLSSQRLRSLFFERQLDPGSMFGSVGTSFRTLLLAAVTNAPHHLVCVQLLVSHVSPDDGVNNYSGQGPGFYIAALCGLIDAGIRVPESTRLLRDILAHASENPDLKYICHVVQMVLDADFVSSCSQDIPDELPAPEELRIKQLLENTIECDEKDRANYAAVLNDYQQGVIKHPKQRFWIFLLRGKSSHGRGRR